MEWGLLAGLSDADRRVVLGSTHRRRFARGEVVFHEADPADTVHFVAEGRLAARRTTPDGDTVTFAVLGPGDAFGELAMLAPLPRRTSTVVALEPAVTQSLSFADFERLRAAHPAVERLLVELLAERVRRLSDHLLEALHVPADERVVRRLSALCERYGPPDPAVPAVVPLTQTEIGELAGASRPTTNRVLRVLAGQGVVVLHRGTVEVRDRAALARRAAR
ncbi:Crp/Fnr family transcriptional regulator [Fodinibacter luteus]|uniref:Crp/Fnr family transcriptional regulator n=1 Tax=Fodinibacter luteus TaxID=552064 RepID=A0ABP8KPQ5_9MICO